MLGRIAVILCLSFSSSSWGQDFSCGLIMGLGPGLKLIHFQNQKVSGAKDFAFARSSVLLTRQMSSNLADDLDVLVHRAGGQNAYATGVMKEMAGQFQVLAKDEKKAYTLGGWKEIISDQGERLETIAGQYQELLNFVCAAPIKPEQGQCWGYWPRQAQ
ncbi:MAG: hypothetical protein H6624_08295 [Bdellovibrionaceae bacterium]|nr:hypothetical protein [Bdellovibrionales bacterium]MCB9084332.1 hypothetical protein [Pseudobdellovibrionaceae bacterium]